MLHTVMNSERQPVLDLWRLAEAGSSANRVLGYVPGIGSIVGILRIWNGCKSYKNAPSAEWQQRYVQVICRGSIELFPGIGGVVCLVIDFVATLFPRLQAQPLREAKAVPLECPFAWKSEAFPVDAYRQLFSERAYLTISFCDGKLTKVLGYIPGIGTLMGISRIWRGIQEYRYLNKQHFHDLSKRSLKWILRGSIELFPGVGGMICIVTDLVATLLYKGNGAFPCSNIDSNGYCSRP
jgi:hypothetical protein